FQDGLRVVGRRVSRLAARGMALYVAETVRANRAHDLAFLRALTRCAWRADAGREHPYAAATAPARSRAAKAASAQLDARAAAQSAFPAIEALHQRVAADCAGLCDWCLQRNPRYRRWLHYGPSDDLHARYADGCGPRDFAASDHLCRG